MSEEVVWISNAKWQAMLYRSRNLQNEVALLRRNGRDASAIWAELCPLNREIRSPLLKVYGIDDREFTERNRRKP